jgi:hypothetical protein
LRGKCINSVTDLTDRPTPNFRYTKAITTEDSAMPQTDIPPTIAAVKRAVTLVEQLPAAKLTIALDFLEQLHQKTDETQLMQVIQQQPVPDRQRLDDLRDRCEWGHLTPEEHQELMQYEDAIEQHNVDRLQAMIQLAQLKNIDLPTLNQQLRTDLPHAS